VKLVVFFTRGMSLDGWRRAGILERELALYREIARRTDGVQFVTYGGTEDMRLASSLGGIEVLSNRWGLSSNIYSLLAPLLHHRAIRRASVVKTNQLNGAWAGVLAKRWWRKPLIVRCGFLWSLNARHERRRDWRHVFVRWIEGWVCRAADRMVVAAEHDRRYLVEAHGVDGARIHVVPNYVDTATFRPREDVKRTPGLICFVGRLSPEKNVAAMLEALDGLEGVHLAVIGDGPLRHDLERDAQRRGLAVTFHGTVVNTEIPALLAAAELFVLPSLYEGNPKALVEAMACGLPVIGCDVQGIRDVIQHDRTGVLCGVAPRHIRDAVMALMGDADRRRRLGDAARGWVERECSLAVTVERELEVLTAAEGARA
jgi:glycosyltransferase involved in cell wall biosynthesis